MPKKPFIKKLYQYPCSIIFFLIIIFNSKASENAVCGAVYMNPLIPGVNTCQFGDDLDESTDSFIQNSCFWKGSAGNIVNSWQPELTYVCIGEGRNKNSPNDSTFTLKSSWVACNSYNNPTAYSVMNPPRLNNNWLNSSTFSVDYDIKPLDTTLCKRCGDINNDGISDIQGCPGYQEPPRSDCFVHLNPVECNFGNLADNYNCAKSLNNQNRADDGNYSYFCSSSNKVVRCDMGKINFSYNDIFQYTTDSTNGRRTYENPVYGCVRMDLLNNSSNCALRSTSEQTFDCSFGPKINNSSDNLDNCDEVSSFEGHKVQQSKDIYCSPWGKKITCDKQISYQLLFGPLQGGTGLDYTPSSVISNVASKAPYNCYQGLPTPPVVGGCNVNTDRGVLDCKVPYNCFNNDTPVPFSRVYQNDIIPGAIYCISKNNSDPIYGDKYFCPKKTGSIAKYAEVSKVLNVTQTGESYVNLDGWGSTNCVKFSEISNECTIDDRDKGTIFQVGGVKKKCRCSRQFNPDYDPLICGITPDIRICEPRCKLFDVKEVGLQPVEIDSPLALVKVVAGFLFWAAVMLFIINFISSGIEYIQHSDEPDKVKDATTRLTNTLFGFIFLLVSAGVINYLLTLFLQIVVPK